MSSKKLFQKAPADYLSRREQPYFRVYYGEPKVDITFCVIRASYDEQASLMTELVLTCKSAEWLYSFVEIGDDITFFGGDLELSGAINYREMFKGKIVFMKSDYQSNGKVYTTITCTQVNDLYAATAAYSFSYPDISASARPFVLSYISQAYNWKTKAIDNTIDVSYLSPSKIPTKASPIGSTDNIPLPNTIGLESQEENAFSSTKEMEYFNMTSWGTQITMPYSEIIKGIATENSWDFGDDTIVVKPFLENDIAHLPNLCNPITQDSQSDWNFLVKLSAILNSKVWLEFTGNKYVLYFVNMDAIRNPEKLEVGPNGVRIKNNAISFFFPRRNNDMYVGGSSYSSENQGLKLFANRFIRTGEEYKYKDFTTSGILQLEEVTVVEDISMINAINPEVSNSSSKDQGLETRNVIVAPRVFKTISTPEDREYLSKGKVAIITNNGKSFYEVPEEWIIRTGDNSAVLSKIPGDSNSSIPQLEGQKEVYSGDFYVREANYNVGIDRDVVSNFSDEDLEKLENKISRYKNTLVYKYQKLTKLIPIPLEKEIRDQPYKWRGVRMSAVVDGNVNIRSQRFYRVIGIIRYGSEIDDEPFFLRALTHTWDTSGYKTKLEFFK